MKKYILIPFLIITLIAQSQTVKDSVSMGAVYANEIYYSLKNGQVGQSAINNWDIAHTTIKTDNNIRANHINGVELMLYPKGDTSKWSSFDTSGWKTWKKLYNNIEKREKGAFVIAVNSMNAWDFGWGVYDQTSHSVIGDSIYLFITGTGGNKTFKKLWIVKQPSNGSLVFRYANLDGSKDTTVTLMNSGIARNYDFYHIRTNNEVLREPGRSNWDISFTRYYAPTLNPQTLKYDMYPVMGVEGNRFVKIARVQGIPNTTALNSLQSYIGPLNTDADNLTRIGSDWKNFNQGLNAWKITDSLSYFIKDSIGNYYHLHFTRFDGSATGKIVFNKTLLQAYTIKQRNSQNFKLTVYPNPSVNGKVSFLFDSEFFINGNLTISDITGRTIQTSKVINESGLFYQTFTNGQLKPGTYFATFANEFGTHTEKFVIE